MPIQKPEPVLTAMESLRDDGWLVVLKVVPKESNYILEGSRSEYDHPQPDRPIGKGKWYAEVSDMRLDGEYRHNIFAFGDTPGEAMSRLLDGVERDKKLRLSKTNQPHLTHP